MNVVEKRWEGRNREGNLPVEISYRHRGLGKQELEEGVKRELKFRNESWWMQNEGVDGRDEWGDDIKWRRLGKQTGAERQQGRQSTRGKERGKNRSLSERLLVRGRDDRMRNKIMFKCKCRKGQGQGSTDAHETLLQSYTKLLTASTTSRILGRIHLK